MEPCINIRAIGTTQITSFMAVFLTDRGGFLAANVVAIPQELPKQQTSVRTGGRRLLCNARLLLPRGISMTSPTATFLQPPCYTLQTSLRSFAVQRTSTAVTTAGRARPTFRRLLVLRSVSARLSLFLQTSPRTGSDIRPTRKLKEVEHTTQCPKCTE